LNSLVGLDQGASRIVNETGLDSLPLEAVDSLFEPLQFRFRLCSAAGYLATSG
jgi:hypothetical protein